MSVHMEFELDTEQAGGPLEGLRRKLSNLSPLHDELGIGLVSSTVQRFEDGQAPNGAYWMFSWRSKEDGGQPLTKDGHLRDSITHEANADGAKIGSEMIYAAIHQYGGLIMPKNPEGRLVFRAGDGFVSVKSVTIEARPYLGISPADECMIEEIAEEYMTESFGNEL